MSQQLVIVLLAANLVAAWAQVPPQITKPPTNPPPPVIVGMTVALAVSFAADLPVSVQWRHEDLPIPWGIQRVLNLTNVQVADAGRYDVVITNAYGAVTSAPVVVVIQADTFQFEDVTKAAGITDSSAYCHTAAWGDYNNDGFPDLFITAGGASSRTNFLYRNKGDGTFTQVGAEAGPITTDKHTSAGAAWLDFNNDGFRDLFVLNGTPTAERNELYWNHGDGTFGRGNAGELTSLALWKSWCAGADYDGDGWLDLYMAEGRNESGPYTNRLYRGTGQGTFTPVSFGPPVSSANDAVWGDFDNDGDPDLYTCTSKPTLWRNDGRGQFTALSNGLTGTNGATHAAWVDYDNDGDLDIAVGFWENALLYRNDGASGFVAVTNLVGRFHTPAWADYDNDGHPDLLLRGGQNTPAKAGLFHNNGDGTFTAVTEAFTVQADYWHSNPWGDYDNDGFMDVVLTHQYGRNRLYHNRGNGNHWIKFNLVGTVSNRDAIGAKVRVQAAIGGQTVWQMQEVNGGYQIQNDTRLNFGLGDATNIALVRIEWPSGNVQELTDVTPNQILNVTETSVITPARPSASLNGAVELTRAVVAVATYQWQFEGMDLAGQTNRTLNLTNIVATQQGRYSVVLETGTEVVTNYVFLTVDPTFTKITEGPLVTDQGTTIEASWADYNGDGYPDLFVDRYEKGVSLIYRNDGAGGFDRMTNGFPTVAGKWITGAWADLDNDGHPDLFAARYSLSSFIFWNNGDDSFTPVQFYSLAPWNVSIVDYDRDGLLDIYVSATTDSVRNRLYRNLGNRTFRNMPAGEVGPLVSLGTFGGAAWADYDDDGWPELFAPDHWYNSRQVRMYDRDAAGRFLAVTNVITQGTDRSLAGAWGDYDNDGQLDLAVARIQTGAESQVYRNLGGGNFAVADVGVPLCQGNSASWADYDNDGFLDLFFTYAGGNTNVLYHNTGAGTFTRVTTGSVVNEWTGGSSDASFSGLWFDYDNDGFLDLYLPSGNDYGARSIASLLFHNNGNSNAWLKVKLVGTTSNRDGVGAKVRVLAKYAGRSRAQRRDIAAGDMFNGNQFIAHFGLGDATNVTQMTIEWPSGTVQTLSNVAPRQFLTVVEPRRPELDLLWVDGTYTIVVSTEVEREYQLEASSDLESWSNVTTFTGIGMPMTFQRPETGQSQRFYRVVSR